VAGLEQRGYVGELAGERFLRKPESPRHVMQLGPQSGRHCRIAGEPTDVDDALWHSQHTASAPPLKQVIDAVALLLQNEPDGLPRQGVLEKALVTWYATRSGAATLGEMGIWFRCTPTTLRANIESHRKMRPALFCASIDATFSSNRCVEAAASTSATSVKAANQRHRPSRHRDRLSGSYHTVS
jgi:hypothetical protein